MLIEAIGIDYYASRRFGMRALIKRVLASVLPAPAYFYINEYVAARDIHSGNRWEPEMELLSQFVHAGDTVIDLGANHGLYSFHLSKLVGRNGVVHAFEPIPPNCAILRRTVKRCKNVVVHEMGVGECDGSARFIIPVRDHIPLTMSAYRTEDVSGMAFTSPMVSLDNMIEGTVSFIKSDIEGGELLAFRGATRLIDRYRPVVYSELVERYMAQRFNCSISDAIDFFISRNYSAHRILGTERLEAGGDGNYLFIPQPVSS
jgi:FkbM family methyltransferase